ncbi:Ankyrin_repeat-containing protein [Hexamita inflata]|uniref:Ankyrin repeat-containing protein n=1 Tax=Hexamita inflata TaxID=28002 RepID=A0AA86RB96_9EUKA|nr:Ankyrin repeat-containing protein [Hexamita inflata]
MELEAAIALNDERCINQYLFDFQRQVMPNLTTGLMYCAVYNRSGLFKYFKHQLFQKSKQKWTAFMFAAEYNSIQMLNLLRKEANFQDVSGFSALMRASIRGNIESVQFIVKNATEIGLKLTRNANGYRIGMNALALLIKLLLKQIMLIKQIIIRHQTTRQVQIYRQYHRIKTQKKSCPPQTSFTHRKGRRNSSGAAKTESN